MNTQSTPPSSELVLGPDPMARSVKRQRIVLRELLAGRDVQVWDGQPVGQGTEDGDGSPVTT
jgi:hypothetical protein